MPIFPRGYTLTHSDATGDLYLTISATFDQTQISGWYTRLMRDEVLAEGQTDDTQTELHAFCHVSGGLLIGTASWRYGIFQRHMHQVSQAFRHGDRLLFQEHPYLDEAPILVHFNARQARFNRVERWGICGDYRLQER